MTTKKHLLTPTLKQTERPFDELMAELLSLMTEHSLTYDNGMINPLLSKLNELCQHSEIEFFPRQHLVLTKMRKLWQLKLFKLKQINKTSNNVYNHTKH